MKRFAKLFVLRINFNGKGNLNVKIDQISINNLYPADQIK